MRYLAIDYGNKRTGLAVCDKLETLCSPLKVISGGAVLDEILKAIKDNEIQAIVIGLPFNMDGTQGFQAKKTTDFANILREKIGEIPIFFQDERLSSYDAHSRLYEKGVSQKKMKLKLDAVAAVSILESFLERCKSDNINT